jgi:hypothetical protein
MEYAQNHTENQRQNLAWQKQENLWHDIKQSAWETLPNTRQSINSTRPGNRRPSLEQQRQWPSQSLEKRSSSEQQPYPSQQIQKSYSQLYFQDHRHLTRQSYGSSQPRRNENNLGRASFNLSTGENIRNAHPSSQSQSYTQFQSEPLTIDRYNGGAT